MKTNKERKVVLVEWTTHITGTYAVMDELTNEISVKQFDEFVDGKINMVKAQKLMTKKFKICTVKDVDFMENIYFMLVDEFKKVAVKQTTEV